MNIINLPKIELHCHLDGSVRPETIIDIAKEENIGIPSKDKNIIKGLMIAPWECDSLCEYLERFDLPISIMQSKKSLERIAFELLEDASKENVKYIEVRFAPVLHTKKGLTIEEVIESVVKGIKMAEVKFDIKGNVILSCMRNMSSDVAKEVIEKGRKFLQKGVVAVDLCANEDDGFCEKFIEPIKIARDYGYKVTIHAGETGIGENVFKAIELLKAERIGHGVFIKDSSKAYELVKDKNITLEICVVSNIQTKAIKNFKDHPIHKFYKDGIKVTINTDNRTVSNTNLTNEIDILVKEFDMNYEDYKNIYLNSVNAAFTDEETKEKLKSYIL